MPTRQHLLRLPGVWIKCPVYFVTACTSGRRRLLDQPPAIEILVAAWRSAPAIHGWAVGRYVVMPDHVHFFATAQTETKSLSAFMRDWKKWTARSMVAKKLSSAPIWQTEFFDHVLRSPQSYAEKWDYVRQNPVRAGLVANPDEWSYQGECESLRF
jgi:REP element-mobilizing transposase RayT